MSKVLNVQFSKSFTVPTEELDKGQGFIKWGKKNDYPFFLIDLLHGSAWHQGIIKNKTYYISGGGIETVSGNAEAFINNEYRDFDMNEVVQRMTFDFEVFGAMCVKGTWNREGTRVVAWEHLDVDACRLSEDERTLFVSDDWNARRQSAEDTNFRTYPALDEDNPGGSFFIYYKEPAKQAKGEKGIYPKPPYVGGITAIQTDCDISKFHMFEIANGFKAGTLINLPGGFPETAEEERKIREQIKGPVQSVESAGEIIITFSQTKDDAPSIMQLSGNDLDKRYEMTEKAVQQNILVAHSITAPTLFGIIQQGSFNAAESGDLFEIFKVTYVSSRQKQIEWLLNYMCTLSGSTAVVKLQDVSPLGVMRDTAADTPAAAVEADPLAAGEIDVAKTALNGAQIASIIDVVAAIKEGVLTPEAALQVLLASFPTIAEAQAREIVGLQSGDMSFCNHKQMFSDQSIELFEQHGAPREQFEIIKSVPIEWDTPADEVFSREAQLFDEIGQILVQLTDQEKAVLTLLQEDDEEAGSIALALGEPLQVIVQIIDKLVILGLYEKPSLDADGVRTGGSVTSTGGEIVNRIPTAEQAPYEIRYTYETRKDVPPVKTKSRNFCLALLRLDRLYTREELGIISAQDGRDVWRYRGGYYTNPETGKTTPWCRHIWMQNLVKRKP
jgi:hypothetical protein